jgi:cell division protein FtsW
MAHTDFVFSIWAEETGLIGATALICLFALLIVRILKTGWDTASTGAHFAAYVCFGAALMFAGQVFVNMGASSGLLPTKGLTLPFVSYGGSSLLSNYILLALLIRVSDSAARRLGELPDDPTTSERWKAWRLSRRIRRAIKRGETPADFAEDVS